VVIVIDQEVMNLVENITKDYVLYLLPLSNAIHN
jgi:hypothetical protein